MDAEHPKALVFDRRGYSPANSAYQVYDVLKSGTQKLAVLLPENKTGYGTGAIQMTEEGAQVWYYEDDAEGEKEVLKFLLAEAAQAVKVEVAIRLEQAPWFCSGRGFPQIFLPACVRDAWEIETDWRAAFFLAEDWNSVYETMREITKESDKILSNNAQSAKETKALLGLLEVFSTGFLAMISLITTANVFNTISTNVLLRRREFAMLRSIGMTRRGIRRILNYECLLCGCKSLLYAAPVSVAITYVISCAGCVPDRICDDGICGQKTGARGTGRGNPGGKRVKVLIVGQLLPLFVQLCKPGCVLFLIAAKLQKPGRAGSHFRVGHLSLQE